MYRTPRALRHSRPELTVTLNRLVPSIAITDPADGDTITGDTVTISGTTTNVEDGQEVVLMCWRTTSGLR